MINTTLFNTDCVEFLNSGYLESLMNEGKKICIVTDPPFNIGYHYNEYKDKMEEDKYFQMLKYIFTKNDIPFVVIHYPEQLYKLAMQIGIAPQRVVSWVYNSNTAKQHRDIAYFNVKPIFSQVLQPYKNLNDKRIQERIKNGKIGCKIYDWWNINQVKNVSKKGNNHPCVMPIEVMKNVVGIIPKEYVIFDPFMGSGTTGVACKQLGYDFIGCEINKEYFEITNERIDNAETIVAEDVEVYDEPKAM